MKKERKWSFCWCHTRNDPKELCESLKLSRITLSEEMLLKILLIMHQRTIFELISKIGIQCLQPIASKLPQISNFDRITANVLAFAFRVPQNFARKNNVCLSFTSWLTLSLLVKQLKGTNNSSWHIWKFIKTTISLSILISNLTTKINFYLKLQKLKYRNDRNKDSKNTIMMIMKEAGVWFVLLYFIQKILVIRKIHLL